MVPRNGADVRMAEVSLAVASLLLSQHLRLHILPEMAGGGGGWLQVWDICSRVPGASAMPLSGFRLPPDGRVSARYPPLPQAAGPTVITLAGLLGGEGQ